MKTILETLVNNKNRDILEDLGMIDENGKCLYIITIKEIFHEAVEWTMKFLKAK